MQAPRSYTAEDVVELQCHGGPVCAGRILDLCLALGARRARNGEFTLRAFLNGRMDLSQVSPSAASTGPASPGTRGVPGTCDVPALQRQPHSCSASLTAACSLLQQQLFVVGALWKVLGRWPRRRRAWRSWWRPAASAPPTLPWPACGGASAMSSRASAATP